MSEDRHSYSDPVELIKDPIEKARREAENGVRQFKAALDIVRDGLSRDEAPFRLTQSIILRLHEKALDGIHPLAGTYRNSPVYIEKSEHMPPPHHEVADLVAELCSYVNDHWSERSGLHLSSYVLWRMNWIHPFADGNGRTARVVSYLVLSLKLRSLLPGSPTIPDQIASDKSPYYVALEKADDSHKRGILALTHMEEMLGSMLEAQLKSATREASH